MFTEAYRVSPSGGTGGDPPLPPHYPKNWLVPPTPMSPPPTVLTQKCRFCHFHAVFDHFAQIVPPPVDPFWKTLAYLEPSRTSVMELFYFGEAIFYKRT